MQGSATSPWLAENEERQQAFQEASEPALQTIRRDQCTVSQKVLPMLIYLEQHLFDEGLNVDRLKSACRIRDNSIAIAFHRQVGQAPKNYMSHLRLQTAARLLAQTTWRIWRISKLLGFSSLGVFSKAFARWAGQRPQSYRRHMTHLQSSSLPPPITSPEFLRRALAGHLTRDEAERLLRRLLQLYPNVRSLVDGPENRDSTPPSG